MSTVRLGALCTERFALGHRHFRPVKIVPSTRYLGNLPCEPRIVIARRAHKDERNRISDRLLGWF